MSETDSLLQSKLLQYEIMDGSIGQQIFNQKWQSEDRVKNVDEKAIFIITFILLQIKKMKNFHLLGTVDLFCLNLLKGLM